MTLLSRLTKKASRAADAAGAALEKATVRVFRSVFALMRTRAFRQGVLVGLLSELAMVLAQGTSLITWARNWSLDSAMRITTHVTAEAAPLVPSLAVVDVDERTWRAARWGGGEPMRAPRESLLELISFALDHNARYVIVDVAIEDKPEVDRDFARGIRELLPKITAADQHLLFVRTLRSPLESHPKLAPEWRLSELDALEAGARIHPVAPYFKTSADGIARDWALWQAACRRDGTSGRGHWQVLPSAQIVIAALQLAPHLQQGALPWAKADRGAPCVVSSEDLPASDVKSVAEVAEAINDGLWRWLSTQSVLKGYPELAPVAGDEPSWFRSRVFFTLPYPPAPEQVQWISALDVLENNPRIQPVDFRRGVSVVGQSFEVARDSYTTPLGSMPGCFVILNGVKSIISPGQLRELPWAAQVAMTAVTVIFLSLLFAKVGSLWGTVFSVVLLAPFLIITSDRLASFGYWSDFGVPLLGMALDQVRGGLSSVVSEHFKARRLAALHGDAKKRRPETLDLPPTETNQPPAA